TFEGSFRGEQAPADLQGPVPSPDLPAPAVTSLTLDFHPQWTEEKALQEKEARAKSGEASLPPACLGCYMEHAAHTAQPHEVSPLMWVPLLVLSLFAIGLGFVGIPEGIRGSVSFYEAHIYPSTPVQHHVFSWTPMVLSIAISLAGIVLACILYRREAMAGERRLRSIMGRLGTCLQQKLYMDHIWAKLLSGTMYTLAKCAEFCDGKIFDGAVKAIANGIDRLGNVLRQEHTGYVQNYLFIIVIALLVLAIAIGYIEPSFATSPRYWAELLKAH
ncbi:hypothetical protein IJT17_03965, partial [bacterium]|nr:hypothetical protein [bacterium]